MPTARSPPCLQDAAALLRNEMAAAARVICADVADALAALGSSEAPQQAAGGGAAALEQLQVVLHLVSSPYFRPAVVDGQLVQALAGLLLATPPEGAVQQQQAAGAAEWPQLAEFRSTLLAVLEALSQVGSLLACARTLHAPHAHACSLCARARLCRRTSIVPLPPAYLPACLPAATVAVPPQQPEHMAQFPAAFLRHLMPALVSAIASSSGPTDSRFCCLRMMSDILALYLTDPEACSGSGSSSGASQQRRPGAAQQGSGGGGGIAAVSPGLDVLLRQHVVPLVPVLLQQEEPMPLYALKARCAVCVLACMLCGASAVLCCVHAAARYAENSCMLQPPALSARRSAAVLCCSCWAACWTSTAAT